MDSGTKKILAVIVVVIVIGGGIGLYMFLPQDTGVPIGTLVTPGAPAGTPADRIIVVGVLGAMTEIQGEGAWRGSYLACEELNLAGGVTIGADTYYFGLVAEDTSEADALLDTSKGVAAATKIISEDDAQFIIGGFRTESVLAYQEVIMDNELLFFSTGAATDIFTEKLNDTGYDRYKYFFRLMPINSTALAGELVGFYAYLKAFVTASIGKNFTNVAILREDLAWTLPISAGLNYYLPLFGYNVTLEIAYPITAEAADFATYWQQIDDAGAQLTVPVISAQGGILMTTQYAAAEPGCLIAGIDVMAQLETYWDETNGGCQYEISLSPVERTNKTSKTIAFWDTFRTRYAQDPLYTAVGSYDAMYVLKKGIFDAQSLNSTEIIPFLEAINAANPLEAAFGHVAFTQWHDLVEGYDSSRIYGVTLMVQWQDGAKEVLPTGGAVYPDYLATGSLMLPPWGINDP
ncbi:MAG: ABC transporter substrate-binding protein [Candidatus Thorarchaeota archaeon]|jgi:branched-chain amino acid transport system substrate-binding protein